MSKQRRRTYLIKTGLQLRYMGIIISTMLLIAFGVGWTIYHTSWSRIANTQDITIDKLAEIFDDVNTVLLRWIAIFALGISILSVFVSHKIAGPVYRLEQTTKEIASGDLTARIQLRHGDELQDLQEAFNTMSESLCQMVSKDREIIEKLIHTSQQLRDTLEKKDFRLEAIEAINKDLEEIVEDLRFVTSGFKLEDNSSREEHV